MYIPTEYIPKKEKKKKKLMEDIKLIMEGYCVKVGKKRGKVE